MTHTISLVPKGKLNLKQPEQLRITASLLTDPLGRLIDGNHDGQPGGDFVASLKGKSVTILSTGVVRATSASQRAVDAIDRVLAGNTQLVTRPARSFHNRREPHAIFQEQEVMKVVLPASGDSMGKPAWLRRVFRLTDRLPHEVDGVPPHRMVQP